MERKILRTELLNKLQLLHLPTYKTIDISIKSGCWIKTAAVFYVLPNAQQWPFKMQLWKQADCCKLADEATGESRGLTF